MAGIAPSQACFAGRGAFYAEFTEPGKIFGQVAPTRIAEMHRLSPGEVLYAVAVIPNLPIEKLLTIWRPVPMRMELQIHTSAPDLPRFLHTDDLDEPASHKIFIIDLQPFSHLSSDIIFLGRTQAFFLHPPEHVCDNMRPLREVSNRNRNIDALLRQFYYGLSGLPKKVVEDQRDYR